MGRFLKQAAATFLAALASVAALNLWVDPYRIWNVRGGLSEEIPRPRAIQEGPLLKARGIRRVRPVTVILGNSRAEIGFDPRAAVWPAALQPVYNAALPGRGIDASERSLEQAIQAGRLRTAVIGLDFMDFLTEPDERVAPQRTSAVQSWHSDVRIILSLDTLLDSFQTLWQQKDPYAANITSLGFNPLNEYTSIVRLEGYGSVFLQKEQEEARAFAKMPKSVFVRSSQTSAAWQTLDRILALARANHVDARFVIYPYHAHILEMLHRAGLYAAFETWKKHLADILNAGVQPDAPRCRLWDFSGYNAYSIEYVPAPEDRTAVVKWYWESGHFKRELGDRVLARILEDDDAAFGNCLDRDNVDLQNLRVRTARRRYLADAPTTGETIDRLFRATAP